MTDDGDAVVGAFAMESYEEFYNRLADASPVFQNLWLTWQHLQNSGTSTLSVLKSSAPGLCPSVQSHSKDRDRC